MIEFIEKAKRIHGEKYDYSKVNYVNSKTKVCIICPEHGEFYQTPNNHLKGRGCPHCNRGNRLTIEEFIEKATKIHYGKYDYSKVEYVNNHTKVCIICPEHGEFLQTPNSHLKGNGCPLCGFSKISLKNKSSLNEFIEKAKKIHNGKYDYSKVKYINSRTKVCVICPKHGEFLQTPNTHLKGGGCKLCANEKLSTFKTLSQTEWEKKSSVVHNSKYDYSMSTYRSYKDCIQIICPQHGLFVQNAGDHLRGSGCPKCNQSKLELEVSNILLKNNIKFIYQANKRDLQWLGLQTLDFYLPDYNVAIECQGEQHFEPVDFAGKGEIWASELFEDNKHRDFIKKDKCSLNNVKLLYFSHNNSTINNEVELLKEILE